MACDLKGWNERQILYYYCILSDLYNAAKCVGG